VCAVYVEVSSVGVETSVRAHRLLLQTLSRSASVELVECLPPAAEAGRITVATGGGTSLHLDVAVSAGHIAWTVH